MAAAAACRCSICSPIAPSKTSTPSTPPAISFPAIRTPADSFLNDFKRRAFELGLDLSGTGVRNDLATADAASRARDVQHIKQWVELLRMGAGSAGLLRKAAG